jgi:uroporphyrinogen III methyltransferase/synthase
MMNPDSGIVVLVGAGPGDPGLITRLGAEELARAQVVIYDHLVHPRLLDLAPRSATRIFAGKQAGRCVLKQPEINDLLVHHARSGARVVRLKGGDPFVFGRGAEEAEHLRACGVQFRVVPGVTAGVGVPAYAGIPITHRRVASAVAFATGHDEPQNEHSASIWRALARFPGTLVIYMGAGRLKSIRDTLLAEGISPTTPAALVQQGAHPTQNVIEATLGELPEKAAEHAPALPGLIVIGDVVERREHLAWFERQPLFGQRILVTRPSDESERAARDLEALGAEVLLAPMIEIRPLDDFGPLDRALDHLLSFDWLVFTSQNGVRAFFRRLEERGQDLRAIGHLRFAAIGPATAFALHELRLRADVVPESFRSESLAQALGDRVRGSRILLARADRGRTILNEELAKVAQVEQVAVYRNVDAVCLPSEITDRIRDGSIDWITLTSSAVVARLHACLAENAQTALPENIKLASISPVTTEASARLGWPIAVEAKEFTWSGLISAIVTWIAHQRNSR